MQSKPSSPVKTLPSADVSIVQETLRLLRVLQRRRRVMGLIWVLSLALGGLYYMTTPRIYQSRASLLVQQNQPETWTKQAGDMMVKDLIDTYRSMLVSDVVLGDALRSLPDEGRVDLADVPSNKWVEVVRENLSVTVIRKTNILEITYRSRSPGRRRWSSTVSSLPT